MEYQKLVKIQQQEGWITENGIIHLLKFSKCYVSQVLTRRQIKKWRYNTPVFIDSQTGTGKSTFILKVLLPMLKEKGKRILILCNRIALKKQYKLAALKEELPDCIGDFTDKGLDKVYSFGMVDIYSYHEFKSIPTSGLFKESYGAVILDECHFFVNDASFNLYTEEIITKILRTQRNAIRIYMTATPEDVFEELLKREASITYCLSDFLAKQQLTKQGIFNPREELGESSHSIIYRFDRDYTYLRPFLFKRQEEIVKRIIEDQSEEKWIIFVNKREDGRVLEKLLKDHEVQFLDAELKNSEKKEAFEQIIKDKKFNEKVLIVTKFLDVGVDLWDEDIRNIVIFPARKTDFLQMLGRKRVKRGECVKVYIKIDELDDYKRSKSTQEDRYRNMCKSVDNRYHEEIFSDMQFPCYMKKDNLNNIEIRYNGLSLINQRLAIEELEQLINRCKQKKPEESIDDILGQYFLEWIDFKGALNESIWIDGGKSEIMESVNKIIKEVLDIPLDEKQFTPIKLALQELRNEYEGCTTRKDREELGLGVSSIKKFLKDINAPYVLGAKKDGKYTFS